MESKSRTSTRWSRLHRWIESERTKITRLSTLHLQSNQMWSVRYGYSGSVRSIDHGSRSLTSASLADLSRNRFTEFPRILCSFFSLERLNLYHNAIKSIPEQIVQIHMLKTLDLRFALPCSARSTFFVAVLVEINSPLFQLPSVNCRISKF